MCLISLFFMNISNSAEMNYGPLSNTICSERPYDKNSSLITSIVLCDMWISSFSLQAMLIVHL